MDKRMKIMVIFGLLCFFLAGIGASSISYGEETRVVESLGTKGQIDWQKGVVRATGVGLPPAKIKNKAQARIAAERAAKVDAYRNLAEIVEGVRVSSETTVKNFTVTDTKINTRVQGFIKGAREIDKKYYSDGIVEVTLEAALNGEGGLSDIILPSLNEPKVSYIEVPGTEEMTEVEVSGSEGVEKREPEPAKVTYTGLVVNAKKIGLQPALSPKILTEDKEKVYDISYTDPQYRTKIGLVGYNADLEVAKQEDRVAEAAYVVEGIETAGPNKSDVIIKTSDAQAFKNLKENAAILERCRVIIVLE